MIDETEPFSQLPTNRAWHRFVHSKNYRSPQDGMDAIEKAFLAGWNGRMELTNDWNEYRHVDGGFGLMMMCYTIASMLGGSVIMLLLMVPGPFYWPNVVVLFGIVISFAILGWLARRRGKPKGERAELRYQGKWGKIRLMEVAKK